MEHHNNKCVISSTVCSHSCFTHISVFGLQEEEELKQFTLKLTNCSTRISAQDLNLKIYL